MGKLSYSDKLHSDAVAGLPLPGLRAEWLSQCGN